MGKVADDTLDGGTVVDSAETVKEKNSYIEVIQREGFLCKVRLKTEIQFPAARTFDILSQPDNTHVFRNIKAITYRKVLEDDHRGRQRIELEHEAEWRFLVFGGKFKTRLFVNQDRPAGKLEFRLAQAGMMKAFEGNWHIYAADSTSQAPGQPGWFKVPRWPFQQHQNGPQQSRTVLELEQSVCPNVIPPPPIDRLLKGIAKRQVCNVVEDLRKEIERIKKEEAHQR